MTLSKKLLANILVLGIPLLWLPIALHWSETPMLSGLFLIATAGLLFSIVRQRPWLGLICGIGYSAVLGLVEGRPEAPYAVAELAAWCALIIGVWVLYRPTGTSASWDSWRARVQTQWRWYALVTGVTLLGLVVRAWQLSTIPLPISDESAAGLFSLDMWYGYFTNPFISGWFEFPSLWFLLQAPFIGLLGKSFFAIRLFSMLLGTLCVPLLIWAVRPVLSRPAALAAGTALALLGIHIHFSRYGLNNIADSLSSIVLLGFVLRYLSKTAVQHAVAIGITLGLAIYGYASARVYPVIVVVVVLGYMLHQRTRWREQLTHLVVAAGVSLVVAGPLVMHYLQVPDQFWATVQRNSTLQRGDDGLTGFERNAKENGVSVPELAIRDAAYTLQAIVWGPVEGWYATPRAILPPLGAALALVGLGWAVWRRRGHLLLVSAAYLLVFCVLSSVNWPVAAGQRLVGVLGVVALLVGTGVEALLTTVPARVDRRITLALAALLVLGGGYQSLEHYFTVFVTREAGAGDPLLHRAGVTAVIADSLPARTWVDIYSSDTYNYDSTPVLRFAMMRLDASLVDDASPDRALPPVIFFPAEAMDRVVMDDHYTLFDLLNPQGEPLLFIAVRDDAPWADTVVRETLAQYP